MSSFFFFAIKLYQLVSILISKLKLQKLDSHFRRIDSPPYKVYQVAEKFKNNIVLCTMRGHIVCIKYGIIYDTFNPSDRIVEDVWVVK